MGWVDTALDGEDKLINKDMGGLDFADTWSGDRIRAGSISYNMGVTFAWRRLIDAVGMSKEEVEHHRRVYAGHCFMHDVMNAYMVGFNYELFHGIDLTRLFAYLVGYSVGRIALKDEWKERMT